MSKRPMWVAFRERPLWKDKSTPASTTPFLLVVLIVLFCVRTISASSKDGNTPMFPKTDLYLFMKIKKKKILSLWKSFDNKLIISRQVANKKTRPGLWISIGLKLSKSWIKANLWKSIKSNSHSEGYDLSVF
jgi:hypothetical protein